MAPPSVPSYALWGGTTVAALSVVWRDVGSALMSGGPASLLPAVRLASALCVLLLGVAAFLLALWRGSQGTDGQAANYCIGDVLGQGAFGVVVSATVKDPSEVFDEADDHMQIP